MIYIDIHTYLLKYNLHPEYVVTEVETQLKPIYGQHYFIYAMKCDAFSNIWAYKYKQCKLNMRSQYAQYEVTAFICYLHIYLKSLQIGLSKIKHHYKKSM